MPECIFCQIVQGKIPSEIVYQDDEVIAFKDINPLAPVHLLVIPKLHLRSFNDVMPEYEPLITHMLRVVRRLAGEFGVTDSGYRVVTNIGADGGQAVEHLHFHLLGGKPLGVNIG